ncbi:MAG: 2OG-Fe(II) oxygenase, partial [Verrucomicrobiota bacterium]
MSNDGICVPYNHDLEPLEEVLSKVRRPGDFFAHGSVEVPLPRVEVDDAGVLSFPVPEAQIQQLIQRAVRAPYGRGENTILDESVRKVWQLPPDKVRIGGKSWENSFQQILATVTNGLGCAEASVSADLYKLLVYDTGGFFKAHRDTEKADGMFGTLVVVLPSAHRGGELVIRHAGREVVVAMARTEFSEISFAAFYADCEHELRPITQGNRVCLIYNLIQSRNGKKKVPELTAPLYDAEVAAVAKLLEEALADTDAPAKLAWLLEHQYSPAELSFATLKNTDAARAKVILAAAERAGCAVHLGIVHIEETGAAQPIRVKGSPRKCFVVNEI